MELDHAEREIIKDLLQKRRLSLFYDFNPDQTAVNRETALINGILEKLEQEEHR